MHKQRIFKVSDVFRGESLSPATLARALVQHSWTLCSGFRIGHLLFLNDATSEDGAQEYAVFDERLGKQVESLTCSWFEEEDLERAIVKLLAGEGGCEPWGATPSLAHAEGSCTRCA